MHHLQCNLNQNIYLLGRFIKQVLQAKRSEEIAEAVEITDSISQNNIKTNSPFAMIRI